MAGIQIFNYYIFLQIKKNRDTYRTQFIMSKSPRNPSKPSDFIGQYNNWDKVHSHNWSCWSTGGNKNMLMRIQHDAEIITKTIWFDLWWDQRPRNCHCHTRCHRVVF